MSERQWPPITTREYLDNRPQWVYRIMRGDDVMYVGMTCNLDATKLRHKYGGRLEAGDHVVLRWAGYRRADARRIEKALVGALRPRLNKTPWG